MILWEIWDMINFQQQNYNLSLASWILLQLNYKLINDDCLARLQNVRCWDMSPPNAKLDCDTCASIFGLYGLEDDWSSLIQLDKSPR